jgi:NADPH2:quinone reductase
VNLKGKEPMRKIVIKSVGGPDVLELQNFSSPRPGAGEIVVAVEAAGINYLDVYQRQGHLDVPRPFTPGYEGAGIVREVGPGVSDPKPGSRVAWINVFGSYAAELTMPAVQAIAVPRSFEVDQGLLFQAVTAQYLLTEYRAIRRGDVVLVHAAAGGVGQILTQWLKHLGAIVIGTASTEEKLRTVRNLGADHAINYASGFLEQVLEATRGRGVDIAFDAVGATTFADTLKALARRGTAVSYGRASGYPGDVEVLPLILKGTRVAGASLFEYIDDPKEMHLRASAAIRAVEEGWLRLPPVTRYPLRDVVAAHRSFEGRGTQGKLALIPAL